jgi:hypothetical protein
VLNRIKSKERCVTKLNMLARKQSGKLEACSIYVLVIGFFKISQEEGGVMALYAHNSASACEDNELT